jgi:structural maintenance of chromosome 2
VYKQGQAGVQKASVTLIFDNEDKENSPLGYEQNTEITVTRQVWMSGIRIHALPRESLCPCCSV